MRYRVVVFSAFFLSSIAWGQAAPASNSSSSGNQQSMPGMDMSGKHHDMSNMKMGDSEKEADPDAAAPAMRSMEGHMDMGPHMKMTELRKLRPGDADRAQQIVEAARAAASKYLDYHVALNDGFKIFLPNIPQKIYHFTNYSYGFENAFKFNPDHPTSLLYEKHGDDYKLIGVMYTAPKRLTEDQLDERIPLSIAQWHEHTNFCTAPAGRKGEYFGPNPKFGIKGSIVTEEACQAEGGTFHPVVFNWMVHVYPFEKDQASIWSVERQHGDAD
ncbi:MAG TPA: hypothetical protein VGG04_05500 [Candidatus Sulfotelmatobacter sp.]|jgi:hypothetical protein